MWRWMRARCGLRLDAPALADLRPKAGFEKRGISVVIPCLNEQGRIGQTVRDCVGQATDASILEIVVVVSDETQDCTFQEAEAEGSTSAARIVVLRAGPGRGAPLREGARRSSCEVLVFLHADVRLPRGWDELLRRGIASDVVAGSFRFGVAEPDMASNEDKLLLWVTYIVWLARSSSGVHGR